MRFPYDTSYRDAQKLLRYRADWLVYGLLAAALIAAPWILPRYYVGEATYIFIVCVASLGLMVVTGFTGQISFGHAAFVAIGAYTHTLLLTAGVPFFISIVLAGAFSGLLGLAIGLPAIRVSGLHLAMVTLAFSIIVEQIVGRWKSITGGFTGIPVPPPRIFGFDLGAQKPFYFLCLSVLTIVLAALINLLRGHAGRAFVGVRDSEAAALSLGIWIAGYKVLAFAISAGITGIAGALFAHHVQFVTPEGFSLLLSLELVMMVVIGGLGSLRGAIFGAVFISLLPTAISAMKPFLPDRISGQFGLETFVFGLILALFILFEPTGLNGRWLKLKSLFNAFPLYRQHTFPTGQGLYAFGTLSMNYFAVEHLALRFGGLTAIRDLSFTVEQGEVFAIIGPNGAGKTSVFNVITRVFEPSAGRVTLRGRDITALPRHRIAGAGIARTFQNIELFESATVMDNLLLGRHRFAHGSVLAQMLRMPSIRRAEDESRARTEDIIDLLDLSRYRNSPVAGLPYGARKIVEIARALATEPELLLLDEPASGLNPEETRDLAFWIGDIKNDLGVTIVMVEHDMSLVAEVADRVLCMNMGEELALGVPSEVRSHPDVIAAYLGA